MSESVDFARDVLALVKELGFAVWGAGELASVEWAGRGAPTPDVLEIADSFNDLVRADPDILPALSLSARPTPTLSADTLVIPFDCHPRYRYWDDRDPSNPPLTVCAILTELDAPARMHRSYCGTCGRAALQPVDAQVGQDQDFGPAVPLARTGT